MYITRLKYTHYSIYHIQYNILKLHYKIIEHNTLQEIEYTSQDIEHTSQDYRIKQTFTRQSALWKNTVYLFCKTGNGWDVRIGATDTIWARNFKCVEWLTLAYPMLQ